MNVVWTATRCHEGGSGPEIHVFCRGGPSGFLPCTRFGKNHVTSHGTDEGIGCVGRRENEQDKGPRSRKSEGIASGARGEDCGRAGGCSCRHSPCSQYCPEPSFFFFFFFFAFMDSMHLVSLFAVAVRQLRAGFVALLTHRQSLQTRTFAPPWPSMLLSSFGSKPPACPFVPACWAAVYSRQSDQLFLGRNTHLHSAPIPRSCT